MLNVMQLEVIMSKKKRSSNAFLQEFFPRNSKPAVNCFPSSLLSSDTYYIISEDSDNTFLADVEKYDSLEFPCSDWEKHVDVAMRFDTIDAAIQYWNSSVFWKPKNAFVWEVTGISSNEFHLDMVSPLSDDDIL